MFTCGLGDIPPELEALARESECCAGYTDPKAPGRVIVHEIDQMNLISTYDNLVLEFDPENRHKIQSSNLNAPKEATAQNFEFLSLRISSFGK